MVRTATRDMDCVRRVKSGPESWQSERAAGRPSARMHTPLPFESQGYVQQFNIVQIEMTASCLGRRCQTDAFQEPVLLVAAPFDAPRDAST